jgi:hypothetical protein
MKFSSIRHKKLHIPIMAKRLKASFGSKIKKKISWPNRLRLSLKAKSVLSVVIIVVLLVSIFAFISKQTPGKPIAPTNTDGPTAPPTAAPQNNSKPTSKPTPIPNVLTGIGNALIQVLTPPKEPGFIETSKGMNSTIWRQVAAAAWQYFQPGIGVDENTSLPNSGSGSPYFTDWDLGVYIQAVIDANATGLIGYNGTWGSSARLEKIVYWLETRELNATTNYPYWFYQSSDGLNYHPMSDLSTSLVDGVDTGRLFVALNNLRIFNSSLAPRINNITLYGQNYNRSNYAALVPVIYKDSLSSTSIYAYYVYSGFASFWPDQLSTVPNRILTNILSSGNVTTNNVTLPISTILGDPLLCSVFDLNNNSQLMYIMRQVYLAHEAYYNTEGVYRAFSEGASLDYHWTYEWVVLGNRTWVILDENYQPFGISPIIYTKVAMGFLAIYNTSYAYSMNVHLEKALPAPTHGFSEGVTEDNRQLAGTGSNTNGLILSAAKYAIQNDS